MHAFIPCKSRHLPIPVKAIGDWIRYRRISLGLSCTRAAMISGIDHWQDIEEGLVPTDVTLIRSIASTLELSYDDVAGVIAPFETHFEAAAED